MATPKSGAGCRSRPAEHGLIFGCIINGVSEVVSIESPSKAGAADVFLEIITQLFLGSDGIVPDSSNRATAPGAK